MLPFDTLIKNVRLVSPHQSSVDSSDIGIKDGKIVKVAPDIPVTANTPIARELIDGNGLLAFPGVVDAHMHCGIYAPLDQDAKTESCAAAAGGVTSSLNYIRTGAYYLNKMGPYGEFFPEVLNLSEGNFHVDYGYHLAPMNGMHIGEMQELVDRFGVASFKIFMFYGSHGLHGKSMSQQDFLMLNPDEKYDFAHFEFIMRELAEISRNRPHLREQLSLSLHCETAEIMRAYTSIVEARNELQGLRAYSASRPPHSEGLAIFIAAYLANEADCMNINLLHLSSKKAVEAAFAMEQVFPHISFKKEVTIGHLLLDVDCPHGELAKVNPPIRPREDVEYLWQVLAAGKMDWVVSDHACCSAELKVDQEDSRNIFLAKSGFGGTEYLLPALVSAGSKRGLSYSQVAKLLAWNPARRYGLSGKGDLGPGYDADIALVDPHRSYTVNSREGYSQQGYSPFDGMQLDAKVVRTLLRGQTIFNEDKICGAPQGKYIIRNEPL